MLAAARHPHKLRLGHLRGNRFEVVLTGAATDDEMEALRARFADARPRAASRTATATSASATGRDNAAAWPGAAARRAPRARQAQAQAAAVRAAVGGVQPHARAARGPGRADARSGRRRAEEDRHRRTVRRRPTPRSIRRASTRATSCPTGPLPGSREIEPPPGTPARALEDEAIAAVGATRDDFARAGRELPGARRPVLLQLRRGRVSGKSRTRRAERARCASASRCPQAATRRWSWLSLSHDRASVCGLCI